MERRRIGTTGIHLSPLMFGTSSLGNMPDTYGYEVDDGLALATLRAILDGPVNCLDTSNNYGFGRSEARIGAAFAELGGVPDDVVISTKLDRDMDTGRFDSDRARRSIEESLERLGVGHVQLLHLHDPEHARDLTEITAVGGALDELFRLKEEGLAMAVGLAMGRVDMQWQMIRNWPFDALINHNRMTVINRSADAMFDDAHDRGIAILNAAPFAGGVLAKGSEVMPRVTYQPADDRMLAPVRRIEAICADHGIAPGALALQFSLRDPRITSTIVGVSRPERVQQTLDWAATPIPEEAWARVEALGHATDDPEAARDYRPG